MPENVNCVKESDILINKLKAKEYLYQEEYIFDFLKNNL
jgi:hypothetical protein